MKVWMNGFVWSIGVSDDMIDRLKLTNFRGVREGEIELAPLTVILGPNNSGKTAILEAVFLAPNPFRRIPYAVPNVPDAVGVLNLMHSTLYSQGYAFLLYNYVAKQAVVECWSHDQKLSLYFDITDSSIEVSIDERPPGVPMPSSNVTGRPLLGSLNLFGEGRASNTDRCVMDNSLLVGSDLSNIGYGYLQNNWASIINLGITKKVAQEVSTLTTEKYANMTIEPYIGGSLAVYAFLQDGRRIRIGDLGEGVQKYIIARILYEVSKPRVLLWDDIESHFNPRMLSNVGEWFSDMVADGRQVILTTHSLEATRIIAAMNEGKTCINLTSLDEGGLLRARKLSLSEVEEFLNAGIDVRMGESLLL
jgi:ABC-type branched-subunit amino acid transport system ATPase component